MGAAVSERFAEGEVNPERENELREETKSESSIIVEKRAAADEPVDQPHTKRSMKQKIKTARKIKSLVRIKKMRQHLKQSRPHKKQLAGN